MKRWALCLFAILAGLGVSPSPAGAYEAGALKNHGHTTAAGDGGALSSPVVLGTTTLGGLNVSGTATIGVGAITNGLSVVSGQAAVSAATFTITGSNSGDIVNFQRQDSAVSANINYSGVDGAITLGTQTNHPFAIKTNGVERMRVLTGGNIGIGQASPGQKLEVGGQARIAAAGQTGITIDLIPDSASAGTAKILTNNYTGAGNLQISAGSDATQLVLDKGSSKVGIGTANPLATFYVVGTVALSTWSATIVTPAGAATSGFVSCNSSVTLTLSGSTATVWGAGSVSVNSAFNAIATVLMDGNFMGTETVTKGVVQAVGAGAGMNMSFSRVFTGLAPGQHTFCIGFWSQGGSQTFAVAGNSDYQFGAREETLK